MIGTLHDDLSKRPSSLFRRVSQRLLRRYSRRQQLALLLAAVLALALATRALRGKPELPRLLGRSKQLFAMGVVDGDGVEAEALGGVASTRLRTGTDATTAAEAARRPPRSWRGLEDHERAPRGALLSADYAPDSPGRPGDAMGKHVRVLWIGDLAQAPTLVLAYVERGFNVTVHTSAERILEGFVPHVRRAYERAIPRVAGFDFLKLLLLYKHGGMVVDADTAPVVDAAAVALPSGCDVLLGKETHLKPGKFSSPTYRKRGGSTYGFNRPYQLLNWAMVAAETRNWHVEELILGAMRHFFGLRDMEQDLVQDVAGSGMISDYVALLHEQHGLDYAASFDAAEVRPIEGLCMLDGELRGGWIEHAHMASWHVTT